MKLIEYFSSLKTDDDLEAYAKRCRTSVKYLTIHTIPGRKIPKKPLMKRLATGSQGEVSVDEVLNHFYSDIQSDIEPKKAVNA